MHHVHVFTLCMANAKRGPWLRDLRRLSLSVVVSRVHICEKLLKTGFFSVHKVKEIFYTLWLTPPGLFVTSSNQYCPTIDGILFYANQTVYRSFTWLFTSFTKTTLRLTARNLKNDAINCFSNQNKQNQPIINHLFAYVFVFVFF